MENFKIRLQQAMDKKGYKKIDLARESGVASSSISDYLNGKYEPKQEKIKMMAEALGVSPSWLLGVDAAPPRETVIQYENIRPLNTKKIPLLGEIACGQPIFADESRGVFVDADAGIECDFCLRCKGDSMTGARINDGDLVFCKAQDMVDNGQIAAVIIGDEATLKRVFYYPGKSLVLQAENPAYMPLVYSADELNAVHIIGRAVAFQSDIK